MIRRIFSSLAVASLLAISSGVAIVASDASAATSSLPVVKGGFNQLPTISFPSSAPPATLQVIYLHRGTGAKVKAGNVLVANYVGQIWRGKVFDSSFTRKQLSSFPIGVHQVIPGWDKGLVGAPLGSRVELVVPPAEGYGTTGDTQAGIPGNTTLVFIVDLVAAYGTHFSAQANPKILHSSADGITVNENGTKQPIVTIAKGATQPTAVKFTELAAGNGKKLVPGLVMLQLVQLSWTGSVIGSTWISGPFGANIAAAGVTGIFDKLNGLNVGSRALIELPKISTGGPYVVVIEVVAEPHDGAT